jgi:hypothetical protein
LLFPGTTAPSLSGVGASHTDLSVSFQFLGAFALMPCTILASILLTIRASILFTILASILLEILA